MKRYSIFLIVLAARFIIAEVAAGEINPADLVILNAKIYSAAKKEQAIAVRGNRIAAVGIHDEIHALIGPNTKQLDAKGCTVTPGFHDSHVHFLSGSLSLLQVELADSNSIADIQEKIRAFAAANTTKSCIVGRGWVYGTFPDGLPSKQLLDHVVPDRPVVMKCYDGHTIWVNSRALQSANITLSTPDPPGGVIVRDPKTGEATGVLKEAAQALVDKIIPEPTTSEKLDAIRVGIATAHRFGVTSVMDAGVEATELELFEKLRTEKQLPLRFTFALSGRANMDVRELDKLDSLRRRFPKLRIPAVKLFVDGVIEAHTAVLLAPYANRTSSGLPETTQEELDRVVEILDRGGWQIIVHAIGDGGIRMTLDSLERARLKNPKPIIASRHRLEHIESISEDDIPRFGQLGVIASMQPYHANPNSNIFGVWAVNLGPERASRAWVWKSILNSGGRIAFGSDWPVVAIDPRLGMHTALTRQTLDGQPPQGFIPQQRLPLQTVIDAYTKDAAFAEFAEDDKGTIEAGKLADIVIWDCDLFELPIEKVHAARVLTTIFDGRVVHQSEPKEAD
jgi:predicted amidohydrolase YtcJ